VSGAPRWIPALVWAGWILRSTLDPAPDPPPFEVAHLDKVAHLLAWAVLAGLCRWALGDRVQARRGLWVSWGLAFGYGLAIEALQAPIATRSAEALDLVADGVGALLGAWLVGRRWR
jgi:VanZ family protein